MLVHVVVANPLMFRCCVSLCVGECLMFHFCICLCVDDYLGSPVFSLCDNGVIIWLDGQLVKSSNYVLGYLLIDSN